MTSKQYTNQKWLLFVGLISIAFPHFSSEMAYFSCRNHQGEYFVGRIEQSGIYHNCGLDGSVLFMLFLFRSRVLNYDGGIKWRFVTYIIAYIWLCFKSNVRKWV